MQHIKDTSKDFDIQKAIEYILDNVYLPFHKNKEIMCLDAEKILQELILTNATDNTDKLKMAVYGATTPNGVGYKIRKLPRNILLDIINSCIVKSSKIENAEYFDTDIREIHPPKNDNVLYYNVSVSESELKKALKSTGKQFKKRLPKQINSMNVAQMDERIQKLMNGYIELNEFYNKEIRTKKIDVNQQNNLSELKKMFLNNYATKPNKDVDYGIKDLIYITLSDFFNEPLDFVKHSITFKHNIRIVFDLD